MGGKAVACNGDVAKPDFGDRIVKTAVDAFGDCHVVVNNAGYTWDSVIQKMSDEQWYAILDVHLTAPFRVLRAFQQHFRQAVEKERAEGKRIVRKVVNISSTSGVNGNAGQSNYSAGKAGIVGLTKTLAKEFGRYDVTVNAVAFGYIQTRLTKPLDAGRGRRDRGAGPQGQGRRAGRPHRRHEPDDPARPRRPAGRGGRLGLSLLQPRQRLCQRPVPGGERRALMPLAGRRRRLRRRRPGRGDLRWPMQATRSRSSNASQSPSPIGAGLLLQPTGLAVLRALGLADEALARGARVVGLEGKTHRGRTRARSQLRRPASRRRMDSASIAARCSTCCTAACARSPATAGHRRRDRRRRATHASSTSHGARHGPFDLVVVADGAHSALRARLMPDARAPLYPWGCIWTTVPDTYRHRRRRPAAPARARHDGHDGPAAGRAGTSMTMFWSLPRRARWRRTSRSISTPGAAPRPRCGPRPPPSSSAPPQADDFTRATYRHVAPAALERRARCCSSATPPTAPARSSGQGANLGLLDAHDAGLRAGRERRPAVGAALFARRRDATVRFYRQASHLLTPFFQSRLAPLGWLRDALHGLGAATCPGCGL